MTDEHKAALAIGRQQGRVVKDYLEALRANKPKRGRKRTPESINARLAAIEIELPEADALEELKLVQERMNLTSALQQVGVTVDLAALEAEFVNVARSYGERQEISYAAWRAVNVDPAVLRAAGISKGE